MQYPGERDDLRSGIVWWQFESKGRGKEPSHNFRKVKMMRKLMLAAGIVLMSGGLSCGGAVEATARTAIVFVP